MYNNPKNKKSDWGKKSDRPPPAVPLAQRTPPNLGGETKNINPPRKTSNPY